MMLTDVLHDDPVAASPAPGQRDSFAQMLATLDAQLDRDLAGLAATGPVVTVAVAAQRPRTVPAARTQPRPRGMLAPAAAVAVTIGVVGCAVVLIALHWRPTRSMAATVPVASVMSTSLPAFSKAPSAAPGPMALATQLDTVPAGVSVDPAAARSCTEAQTALGLCTTVATHTNPTTTPESSP